MQPYTLVFKIAFSIDSLSEVSPPRKSGSISIIYRHYVNVYIFTHHTYTMSIYTYIYLSVYVYVYI